jgi:hypothetical protein
MELLARPRVLWMFLIGLLALNIGIALKGPPAALAQTCPPERSDCTSGTEVCKACSGCICWQCGRDCGVN